VVDNDLEGLAAAPDLLFEENSDVVVDGESSPHIVMLEWKAS
jgi:hypothetical protein